MENYKKLLLNNKAWVREKTLHDPGFFENLAKDQKPDFLWIGCSDSRVPAEEVTGARPGELFVHRNVANLVVATDLNLLSVLHYAINFLKVKHVVVCGHYGCGGVKGSLSRTHLGLIDKWLEPLKDTYVKNSDTLDPLPPEAKVNKLVELSVIAQVNNLAKTHVIQQAWKNEQRPLLHGWIYNLGTGVLEDLIMMDSKSEMSDIYRFQQD